ncbi:MAG: hypothetical protein KIG85_06380, partial [Thiopseudomonas sp.]|nr:hypothetical protein [Thiopseudomonas sp.]
MSITFALNYPTLPRQSTLYNLASDAPLASTSSTAATELFCPTPQTSHGLAMHHHHSTGFW